MIKQVKSNLTEVQILWQTRLVLIGGGENAASYTTVTPRVPNAAFVAVVDPQPDRAQSAADSLGASMTANSLEKLLKGARMRSTP